MEASARNLTPDKLPAARRQALQTICDRHLEEVLTAIKPRWLVGIGAFAEKCATRVAPPAVEVGRILHPSPASPAANRGWAEIATRQLVELGIWAG
jgi:single-strand selective monofunctional uracil DNA glycosylase